MLDRPGIAPKDVTQKVSRTMAIVVPNQQGVKSEPWKEYVTSVKEVEKASFELYDEFSQKDADFRQIFEQWKGFRDRIYEWNNINEGGFSRYSYGKLKK